MAVGLNLQDLRSRLIKATIDLGHVAPTMEPTKVAANLNFLARAARELNYAEHYPLNGFVHVNCLESADKHLAVVEVNITETRAHNAAEAERITRNMQAFAGPEIDL